MEWRRQWRGGNENQCSHGTQMLWYLLACSAWAEEENRTTGINYTVGNKKQQGETKYAQIPETGQGTDKGHIDKICWGAVVFLKRQIWPGSVPKEPVTGSRPSCVAFMPFSIFIRTESSAGGEWQCSQHAIKTWRQSEAIGSRTLVILRTYVWIVESSTRCLSEQ